MSLDPALLAAVVDTAACLICVFDREGRVVQFNRACEDTSGYAFSEVQGRAILDLLVPPEEHDSVLRVRARLYAGERHVRYEHEWLTRDARRRLIEWASTVILDEDGDVAYVVATGIDVTEQRQAERALEESEERFRHMVEHLPLLTYRSAVDGRSTPLWVSPQIEPLLGYTPEEWLSNPTLLEEVVHPEDRERVLAEIAAQNDGNGVGSSEYRLVARDGRVVWLHDTSVVVRDEDGRPLYGQGFAVDVTERRRAEEALRESEERFRQLAENIDEAFILADTAAGRALYLSPAFEAIWGRSRKEVGDDTALLQECIHPEDRERVLAATSRVAAEPYDLEYRIVRPDGEVRWVHDRGVPVRGDDGEAHRAAGIASDVTERKLTEEALGRRDAILRVVGDAAERLLSASSLDDVIGAILDEFGRAADVSRAYIFENYRDAAGRVRSSQLHEWVAEAVSAQLDNPSLRAFVYPTSWEQALAAADVVRCHAHELDGDIRLVVDEQGIRSLLIVPIFAGGRWWGFLGFDECRSEREWSPVEIDALRAAAGILGAALERERVGAALRESEERFRALFDSAPIGIGLFGLDGSTIARNAAYERILGYSPAELAEMPAAAFVHPEDQDDALSLIRDLAAGRRDRGRIDQRCFRADGTLARTVVTASVARAADGQPRFIVVVFEDVTEVRQAEEALRESEERFRALFDSAPIGIGVFDLDGRTIARNAAYERILGYTAAELAAMPAAAFVHPEDLDETLEHFRELATGQRERDYLEYRCHRKDGTLAWMLLSGAAVRGPDGRPRFVVAALQDATEVKLAEVALRESEERYRELFETASDLVYTHDLAGTITSVNRAAERASGYSRAEALGLSILDLVAPDYREFAAAMIERKLAGSGPTVYELEIVAKDGRRVPLEVSSRLILEEGVPIGVQGVARDVTERRRGEALAHGQRRVLEVIARGAPLADALDEIARLVEEQAPGRLCSILLYDADRDRLVPGAAPSLPQGYTEQIEAIGGLPVGPKSASCGTAAFRREPVSVADAFTDPLWEDFRELAAAHDLRACWSTPILSTDMALLGTLSLYAREPVEPAPEDVELVGIAAHMASIAIARKQAEGRLVDAERRYRYLAEQLPIITYVDRLDEWSSSVYISPQVEEILGYAPDEWLADREFFSKVIHPDDRDRMLAQVAERNATGQASGSDYRVIAKDGRVVWVREEEMVALDDEGNPLYAQGYLLDMTERKQAEARLAEAEQRFRRLAEQLPLITYVDELDPARPLSYVSPQAVEILGYPQQEWLRDPTLVLRLTHPDDRERLASWVARRDATGEPARGDFRAVARDGRVVWLRIGESIVRDEQGRPLQAQGYLVDITELKEAEGALRESEERFREMAEAVDECFWLAGPGGDLIYVSPVYERIWGVPWTGSDAVREAIHPADRQWVEPVFDGKAAASFDIQYRIVRPDGEVRWVRDRCFHVRDDQGVVQRIAGIVMDITERKRENEARRQLEEQVRHVQKLESLGVLAGGIAHDFNNLLMGVLGNAGLALAELPEGSPVRDKVDRIETAALRAAELTNQMLAYAGKGRFVVAPLDLSRVVEEMAHLLGTAISKKAVLRFDLGAELPAVEGDATQLRQVVMNLITNASDALGDESGVVTVRTDVMDADRAYLATTYLNEDLAEGSYVYVEVADTGCGMDGDTLARIFDPFFTTKFTGRGLGLAGVLGIVRAHGGAIRVDSEPGLGTTFRVLLPAAKTAWAETPRETPSSETRRLSGTILVVDDEAAVRAVARAALERSGFTVLTAGDGKEGVDVFREHAAEIGAVVLDMTMPVMGGREVLEELHRIRPGVRVVLSSGYTEEDATERLEGARVVGFIQKPYRPAELVEKLRSVLD